MNLKKSMSNINSVKEKLSNTIETALCEVIKNKKCILLDVPYYNNIGDTLILQGTLDFLSKNNIKCIRQSSIETFDFPLIDSNITILLQGGGNFGDIWERHQIFRSKVISKYPSNQIVILPQTVYFNNHKKMIADAAILAKHSNLTICGRDDNSYQILIKYYSANSILLLPDMAFCIKNSTINKIKQNRVVGTLLLKRKDCELSENIDLYQYIGNNTFEEKDWPTLE